MNEKSEISFFGISGLIIGHRRWVIKKKIWGAEQGLHGQERNHLNIELLMGGIDLQILRLT